MDAISQLGVILGSSWASGVNLYLTTAGLGIAHRMGWIVLPGELDVISHPVIIGIAVVVYLIEFFADKIPYVDSAWDSVHTLIRPAGAAAMAYFATAETGPIFQSSMTLLGGAVAMDSHMTKAASRVVINTSPEPVSNSVASIAEDISVAGVLYLMIVHPVLVAVLVVAFILFSIWFIPKLFGLFRKAFGFLLGKKKTANP